MSNTMITMFFFSFKVFQAADAAEDSSADAAADINNRWRLMRSLMGLKLLIQRRIVTLLRMVLQIWAVVGFVKDCVGGSAY